MPVVVPFFGSNPLSIVLAEPVVMINDCPDDTIAHTLHGILEYVLTKPTTVTQISIKLVGKLRMMWPDGLGRGGSRTLHDKVLHEQKHVLQSWPEGQLLEPGLHRWTFDFFIPSEIIETIEDNYTQVYYYLSAAVRRVTTFQPNLRSRQNLLILRTHSLAGQALMRPMLIDTSTSVQRTIDECDVTACLEKPATSSGTQIPITVHIQPHGKELFLEAISVIVTERRTYRFLGDQMQRTDENNFKLTLISGTNMADPAFGIQDVPETQLRKLLTAKNAHVAMNAPFQYRLILALPCCPHLNHSTQCPFISITHHLHIEIDVSHCTIPTSSPSLTPSSSFSFLPSTASPASPVESRKVLHMELPLTVLDCRLKEDANFLPTYAEALTMSNSDVMGSPESAAGIFRCPCYLDYCKNRRNANQWPDINPENFRNRSLHTNRISLNEPPPYDDGVRIPP
ncbi:uncharacterized protein BYT42DRAFT_562451 [Radiomyces spectabilis]|uniref:uncharacterized protein n=1 Tax=Radiomyces spectabilis TaxID=64574 RepID=UPI00222007EF|nr:uncharacterized protein BYT42DRAFT_562451 [Radiomyces spectabilis]KAI8384407.1 hypothetical protein BYT42DRAFT_562451 [Radiomyces spectabilis]